MIEDVTHLTNWKAAEKRLGSFDRIIFHRFGGDPAWWDRYCGGEVSLVAVEKFFESGEHSELTRLPYGFGVHADGRIEQGLPLSRWNIHAGRRWSPYSVAVAVFGDFRSFEPPRAQLDACIELADDLTLAAQLEGEERVSISGHTELPGATSDKRKSCPGKAFDLQLIRDVVADRTLARRHRHLEKKGIIE